MGLEKLTTAGTGGGDWEMLALLVHVGGG
jgi:hypothetical protein